MRFSCSVSCCQTKSPIKDLVLGCLDLVLVVYSHYVVKYSAFEGLLRPGANYKLKNILIYKLFIRHPKWDKGV